jgi:hypothetical protein
MACCGGGHQNRRIAKEIVKRRSEIAPLGDLVQLVFAGTEKDVFYGSISGNRYAVSPSKPISVDRADLERLLEDGEFILV